MGLPLGTDMGSTGLAVPNFTQFRRIGDTIYNTPTCRFANLHKGSNEHKTQVQLFKVTYRV